MAAEPEYVTHWEWECRERVVKDGKRRRCDYGIKVDMRRDPSGDATMERVIRHQETHD